MFEINLNSIIAENLRSLADCIEGDAIDALDTIDILALEETLKMLWDRRMGEPFVTQENIQKMLDSK